MLRVKDLIVRLLRGNFEGLWDLVGRVMMMMMMMIPLL